MRMRLITLLLLGLGLAPSHASAWHSLGHMAVARAAWTQLSDKHKAQVTTILKAHPHYAVYLSADRPASLGEIEWAFMRAAVWPDWVRGPRAPGLTPEQREDIKKQFNKPVWHYINLPHIHPNDSDKFDSAAIRKQALEPALDDQGEPRHVLAALQRSMDRLGAANVPDKDKAVSLCWLLHLVGDLHQPLHATGLIASKATYKVSFAPPHGDEGGNRMAIKAKANEKSAVKLHFYWDALLFGDVTPIKELDVRVTGWLKEPRFQRDQLPELKATDFLDWAEESLKLAREVVYKGEGGFLKARALPKTKVDLNGLDAPTLPDGYRKAAEEVATRRMVLAGYRIADQLRRAFEAPKK
ncbi:MAG: S1/P1 nuclease [Gemmataceae bacterium]|nr:S1/P1 nuclease [Gemmataceae bacterium]